MNRFFIVDQATFTAGPQEEATIDLASYLSKLQLRVLCVEHANLF
jgi:hypothetical protein